LARMESILDGFLVLSRINAQTPGSVCQTVAVAAAVAEDLGPSVKNANGVLRIEVEDAKVHCSEGLLRQALWNLGENAVKFRRSGLPLEIEIRGKDTGHTYEFCVSDNGLGMSPEEVDKAFDPFFRGKNARLNVPGTGLGLSIVKRIIEASGGTACIDSRIGCGTTFRIQLSLLERHSR